MKKICGAVVSCGINGFGQRRHEYRGAFRILRFNFVIDEGFDPWIYKVDDNIPDNLYFELKTEGSSTTKVNYSEKVVRDALDLMLWVQRFDSNYQTLLKAGRDRPKIQGH